MEKSLSTIDNLIPVVVIVGSLLIIIHSIKKICKDKKDSLFYVCQIIFFSITIVSQFINIFAFAGGLFNIPIIIFMFVFAYNIFKRF